MRQRCEEGEPPGVVQSDQSREEQSAEHLAEHAHGSRKADRDETQRLATGAMPPPGTIQSVAAALEQTMREDVAAGHPMIAALVISRAGDMPRRGFFDLAVALDRCPEDPRQHRAAWQAEYAAVLGTQADRDA